VDLQFEGGELVDGAGGSVFAGDPLGVEECERSGRDGDFEVGVEQAFGCFTSVEGDFDGSGRVVAGLGWDSGVLRFGSCGSRGESGLALPS
jgi:hypothetical protein